MDSGRGKWWWKGGRGVPVGGFMSWLWWLAVVLVCTGTLVMHVRAGPICAAAGTCPNSKLGMETSITCEMVSQKTICGEIGGPNKD